jgi:hypothetical protein
MLLVGRYTPACGSSRLPVFRSRPLHKVNGAQCQQLPLAVLLASWSSVAIVLCIIKAVARRPWRAACCLRSSELRGPRLPHSSQCYMSTLLLRRPFGASDSACGLLAARSRSFCFLLFAFCSLRLHAAWRMEAIRWESPSRRNSNSSSNRTNSTKH